MSHWLKILLAVAAALVLAPLAAWLGKRHGGKARGGLVLASFLLGVGEPLDPPPKHRVESAEPGKDARTPGEPPLD